MPNDKVDFRPEFAKAKETSPISVEPFVNFKSINY